MGIVRGIGIPLLWGQGRVEMDWPWQEQDMKGREPSIEGNRQGDRERPSRRQGRGKREPSMEGQGMGERILSMEENG